MIEVNKYNKGPINQFKWGGFSDWANIANVASGIGAGFVSDGLQSKVGNITSGLSDIALAIPGPWGKIAAAGTKLVGGAVNRLFGSSMNNEAIASFEAENAAQANRNFASASVDELLGQNYSLLGNIKKSQVGRDGVWSTEARDKTNRLNLDRQTANYTAVANYKNASNTVDKMSDRSALLNELGYTSNAAFGGKLASNGALWDTGLTEINEGSTHELNPNEGVQVGVDPEGTPNLVEEGEVIHNNYVFSKRLKADGGLLDMVKLPSKYNGKAYADVAKKIAEESKERPNDPISKRSFEDAITKLQMAQEYTRQMKQMQESNMHAFGGKKNKFTPGGLMNTENYDAVRPPWGGLGTFIQEKPPIYAAPYKPGVAPKSKPVVKKIQPVIAPENNFRTYNTLEEIAAMFPNPRPIPNISGPVILEKVPENNPVIRTPLVKETQVPSENKLVNEDPKGKDEDRIKGYNTAFRMAPVLANLTSLVQNITSNPDYSAANAIDRTARESLNYPRATANYDAQYMRFNPMDASYYASKLGNQANANRQAIIANNNGNIGAMNANMLAQNYNDQTQLGDIYRKGVESDYEQYNKVLAFNNGINQTKAELAYKNIAANQDAFFKSRSALLTAALQSSKMRSDIDSARSAAISANLTNLAESLSKIGKENMARNMVMSDPSLYYTYEGDTIKYKDKFYSLDPDLQGEVKKHAKKNKPTN